MSADISAYTGKITSEHSDKPKFMATIAALVQPLADIKSLIQSVPGLYDLDAAEGAQLDTVGLWIGRSRYLSEPVTNVYFSLDVDGLGLDQGIWLGPFDPVSGLVALPDDVYRTLLRAKIAANRWDGSIPGAYDVWSIVFSSIDYTVFIQDLGNMAMLVGISGTVPDAVTLALLAGGYIGLKPAGVRIAEYVVPSETGPLFGFDIDTSVIKGFDDGIWGQPLSPST